MEDGGSARDEVDRLAAVMDAEVRAEQADYERMALEALWRARTLADVAREWLVRGDLVEVSAAGEVVRGAVVHVGEDVVVLRTPSGPVDVAPHRCEHLRVVERSAGGGTPPGPGPRTLRARLTEHEVARTTVRLLTGGGEELVGVVDAVAVDHVLLATRRGQVVVPDGRVVLVRPAADPRGRRG